MDDLESMYRQGSPLYGMDMDTMQQPHPGLGAMGNVMQRSDNQEVNEEEILKKMLAQAQQMFPQWPPIAQYMWAQGQIQNVLSTKKQANPQFPMKSNPKYQMTY